MPYASASPLLVVVVAFNALAGLLWTVDHAHKGVSSVMVGSTYQTHTHTHTHTITWFLTRGFDFVISFFFLSTHTHTYTQKLRPIGRDSFAFALEKRDERIDAYLKRVNPRKGWW